MFQQFYSDSDQPFWRFFCSTRILAWQEAGPARRGLERLLAGFGARNPLVVSDRGVAQTPFFREFLQDLNLKQLLVGAEGDMTALRRYADDATATSADLLIAVGGGSVLDAAKCLTACLPGGFPPEALLKLKHQPEHLIPLICVPTTFGTGSEANTYSHLHLPDGKVSFKRQWLAPTAAILVGEAGLTLPQQTRFLTALDAWLHALEALTLRRERSPFCDALLHQALALHADHLEAWISEPDAVCGLAMATASCLGGLGINNARTGLIHALATPFAEKTGLPHNQSLLPFIGPVLAFHAEAMRVQFGKDTAVRDLWERLRPMAEAVMGSSRFSLDDAVIPAMAKAVERDAVLFKENPVDLNRETLEGLYVKALG